MTAIDPHTRHAAAHESADDRHLEWAATFFTVAVLLHNGDHVRRGGDSVSADVFWVGSAAIVLEVGVVVLLFLRHRLAPLVAVAAGFGLAAGYVLVHFAPARGWLSDSLLRDGVSGLSIGAALLEVAAALTLGSVGLSVLRRRGGLTSATLPSHDDGRRSFPAVLAHPVVGAMLAGNVMIFGLSLGGL